jgi:hypothetical protein
VSRLPAFGEQRPDEAWLAEQLRVLAAQLQVAAEEINLFFKRHEIDSQISNQTAKSAVQRLLLASLDTARALICLLGGSQVQPADSPGEVLLEGVCSTAPIAGFTLAQYYPVILGILDVLASVPSLAAPKSLQAAMSGLAVASAADGDVAALVDVLQRQEVLALGQQVATATLCAGIARACELVLVAIAEPKDRKREDVLLQLWRAFQETAAVGGQEPQKNAATLEPAAAAAIVAVLVGRPAMGQQLITPEVPLGIMSGILWAAVDSDALKVVLDLLQHCSNMQQLQQLPYELLKAVAPLPCLQKGAQIRQQVIEQLLQQGHGLPGAAVDALLQDLKTEEGGAGREQWQQLLEWLSAVCRSAPPTAAASFLVQLLITNSEEQQLSPDQSWQLYELLLTCQKDWGPGQQGLPAAAADALIQQQGRQQMDHGKVAKLVVQVWDHYNNAAAATAAGAVCFVQLHPATQDRVVTALVTTGDDQQAVSLVQEVPQLLPTLAAAWQQLGKTVEVGLLEDALALAVQEGTQKAAGAAQSLLGLVKGQQVGVEVLRMELAVQLLQLLCKYGKVVTAAGLLPTCLGSPSAVVSFFTAAAKQPTEEQIRALAGIGVGMGRDGPLDEKQQQQQLLKSLDQLLELGNVTAIGLFWQGLEASRKCIAQESDAVLAALSKSQQQQILMLCCSSRPSPAAPSFTARQLAAEAMQCSVVLSAESSARLITAVAKDHEELQPCQAAVLLGVVTAEQMMGAGGSSSSGSGRRSPGERNLVEEVDEAGLAGTLSVIAQLCLVQLGDASSSTEVEEVGNATDWVARYSPEALSPEGAAAALFAVWNGQQQQQQQQQDSPAISPVAAGVLGLALYHAARKGSTLSAAAGWTAKPSLDSLVLDLALAAAGEAGQWEEGKACLLLLLRALAFFMHTGSSRSDSGAMLAIRDVVAKYTQNGDL